MKRNLCVYIGLMLVVIISGSHAAEAPTPTPRAGAPIILLTETEEYADSSSTTVEEAREMVPVTGAGQYQPPARQPVFIPPPPGTRDSGQISLSEQTGESPPPAIPASDDTAQENADLLQMITEIERTSGVTTGETESSTSEILEPASASAGQEEQSTPEEEDPLSYIEANRARFEQLMKQTQNANKSEPQQSSNLTEIVGTYDQAIKKQLTGEYEIIQVMFDPAVYELENLSIESGKTANKQLQNAVHLIQKLPSTSRIYVLGYADDYPEPSKNLALAENRARHIQAELVARLFNIRVPFPDIVYKSVQKTDRNGSGKLKMVEILIPRQ